METAGWRTLDGAIHLTDPGSPDSDSDGLTDADEAGALVVRDSSEAGVRAETWRGWSDPLSEDSDRDGLSDGDEAELGTDPNEPDTDADGLVDGREVETLGLAPELRDTDGDGFDDGFEDENRESRGLDPLWSDEEVSRWTYAGDFAKGLTAGDLWREDSIAWLVGNLAAGATSSVPLVGSVLGAATDLRDAVGSAIKADWVGSGYSLAGAVPGGDAVAIPAKAARFVTRNPQLAPKTARAITRMKIPLALKLAAVRRIWPVWDDLVSSGADDEALYSLQLGRTDLEALFRMMERNGHAGAPSAPAVGTVSDGIRVVSEGLDLDESEVARAVASRTTECETGCTRFIRQHDLVADRVAHEVRVGHVALTPSVERQIRTDAWLRDQGIIEGAEWDFVASSITNTLGASSEVLDLLEGLDITYSLHLPMA